MIEINNDINASHEYQTDLAGHKIGDFWKIMAAGERGDCEDFALTKLDEIINQGIMPVENLQVLVGATVNRIDHAYLVARTNNRGNIILDNRFNTLLNLDNVPYRTFGYQRYGVTWGLFSTQLENVPMSYMAVGSLAYFDGDNVLVRFNDQKWDQPEVVGLKVPRGGEAQLFSMIPLYVDGIPSNQSYLYDHRFNSFEFIDNYPTISNIWLGAIDGDRIVKNIFSLGGLGSQYPYGNVYFDYNHQYNFNGSYWKFNPPIPHRMRNPAIFCMNTRIHFISGIGRDRENEDEPIGDIIYYTTNYEYDQIAETYITNTSPGRNWTDQSENTFSDHGFIFGGRNGSNFSNQNSTTKYSQNLDSFETMATSPAENWYDPILMSNLDTGRTFKVGGRPNPWFPEQEIFETNRNYEFDPVLQTWTRMSDWNSDGYRAEEVEVEPNKWEYRILPGTPLSTDWDDLYGPEQGLNGYCGEGGYGKGVVLPTFEVEVYNPNNPFSLTWLRCSPTKHYLFDSDTWEIFGFVPNRLLRAGFGGDTCLV